MRVRCSFCGAEYEAAVTRAALVLVDRCEQCGRARLQPVEGGAPCRERPASSADSTGVPPDQAA